MTIIIDDFKIIQNEFGFDLLRIVEGQKIGTGNISSPNGEKFEKEVVVGHYVRLENIIKEIVHLNFNDKKDVVSLKEFLVLYKEQVDRIENMIKL